MAKSNLTKFLTGVAVISAGVALGLAVYNKFDKIKHELEDDEFEDDDFFDDDMEDDVEDNTYVVINADVEVCDDDTDSCEDEAVVEEETDAPAEEE